MDKKEDFEISDDVAEWIGLKKSEYLSKLINLLEEDDYGFEKFHLLDHKITETIESPDRLYNALDEGYKIRTYIKSYDDEIFAHQLVIGLVLFDNELNAEVYIPVLIFITKNPQIVKEFSIGESKDSRILN